MHSEIDDLFIGFNYTVQLSVPFPSNEKLLAKKEQALTDHRYGHTKFLCYIFLIGKNLKYSYSYLYRQPIKFFAVVSLG